MGGPAARLSDASENCMNSGQAEVLPRGQTGKPYGYALSAARCHEIGFTYEEIASP